MTIQPCADILARDVSVFAGSTHTTPIETRTPRSRAAAHSRRHLSRLRESLRHLLATGNQARYRLEKEKSLAFTPCCALQTRARDIPVVPETSQHDRACAF